MHLFTSVFTGLSGAGIPREEFFSSNESRLFSRDMDTATGFRSKIINCQPFRI